MSDAMTSASTKPDQFCQFEDAFTSVLERLLPFSCAGSRISLSIGSQHGNNEELCGFCIGSLTAWDSAERLVYNTAYRASDQDHLDRFL